MKRCSRCDLDKEDFEFWTDRHRPDGLYCACKECMYKCRHLNEYKEKRHNYYIKNRTEKLKKQKEYTEKNRDKVLYYQKLYGKEYYIKNKNSVHHIFKSYKSDAKRRNIDFSLNIEYFASFWQKPCVYCGSPIETIRIDRKDNSSGYTVENCVSCCHICNFSKGTYDIQTWYDYIRQIVAYNEHETTRFIYNKKTGRGEKYLYHRYKWNAFRKNINFNINWEQFISFTGVPCIYCGTTSNIIGIDRVDNSIGYTVENCVSCCRMCNSGKNNVDYDSWNNWLKTIINHNREIL